MQVVLKKLVYNQNNNIVKCKFNDKVINYKSYLKILHYANLKNWNIKHNIRFLESENEHIYYISNK